MLKLFPIELYDRAKCGDDEKAKCLALAKELLSYSEEARKAGLLSLEETIKELEHPFLRQGLQLTVDGVDIESVWEMLTGSMLASGIKGVELLRRMLMTTAIMSLAHGENTRLLTDRFCFLLGDPFLAEYQKTGELPEAIKIVRFSFEDIAGLDDRCVQRLLREIDWQDLLKALKTASVTILEKILKNLSKRASEMLKEDLEYIGPLRISEVEDARLKIASILRKLEEQGEIVFPEELA